MRPSDYRTVIQSIISPENGTQTEKRAFSLPSPSRAIDDISKKYNNLDPSVRRGILGALATGAGSLLFGNMDGDLSDRLLKSIALAGIGGVGTYALSEAGGVDRAKKWIDRNI